MVPLNIQALSGTGVLGLAKSDSPRTREVAFQLAQNWIRTNFKVYSQTSAMYEKVSSGLGYASVSSGASSMIKVGYVRHCQA